MTIQLDLLDLIIIVFGFILSSIIAAYREWLSLQKALVIFGPDNDGPDDDGGGEPMLKPVERVG